MGHGSRQSRYSGAPGEPGGARIFRESFAVDLLQKTSENSNAWLPIPFMVVARGVRRCCAQADYRGVAVRRSDRRSREGLFQHGRGNLWGSSHSVGTRAPIVLARST